MTKSKTHRNKSKQQDPTVSKSEKHVGPGDGFCPPALPARPGGKLGLIVGQLATEAGASADELAKATGWQRHTVLGALSRLRSRGFEMQLRDQDGKKAYRLDRAEA
jgi:biotin operon repressor